MHSHLNGSDQIPCGRRQLGSRGAAGLCWPGGPAEKRRCAGRRGILGLQRTVGNDGVTALLEEDRSPVHDVISSGGRPLDPDVRADMEARLGHDFSDVRVHDDSAAHDSATAVNAHAYTVGSNVVFQRDQYDPVRRRGQDHAGPRADPRRAAAQRPVDGTAAPGGIKVSDPSDRFEREAAANADRVMSGPAPVQTAAVPARDLRCSGTRPRMSLPYKACSCSGKRRKRSRSRACSSSAQGEEEEEPVQARFVQREDEEEKEGEPPA